MILQKCSIILVLTAFVSFYALAQSSGTPISVKGKRIDTATVEQPTIDSAKPPQQVSAYTNSYLAGSPAIVLVNQEQLLKITPGQNGVPLPQKLRIPVAKVPARRMPSVQAAPPAFKDVANHDIRYLDVDQGMNSSYISHVCEDSRGYLWLAGWPGGVWRYDGVSFTAFTTEQGLPYDEVTVIYEDTNKNLWFGSRNGITKYDGFSFTNYTKPSGNTTFDVREIIEDRQGIFWLGLLENGLVRFDGKSFTHFTTAQGLPDNDITTIKEDGQGNLWVGTSKGLCRFDGKTFTHFLEKDGLVSEEINEIMLRKDGSLVIATIDGLSTYDGAAFSNFTEEQGLLFSDLRTLLEDKAANLWIGTKLGGVYKFDGKWFTQFTENEGLSSNSVRALLEDSSGQIWAATNGSGVNIINPASFVHFTSREGLSSSVVNHIMEDSQHNLWFATENYGAIKYDGRFFYFYTTKEGLHSNDLQYIMEDSQGNMWFASYFEDGVAKFDGRSFTTYTTEQGLSSNNVWAMLEDENGQIWFSTEGGGVCMFDGTSFTHFSEAEGFPHNVAQFSYLDQNQHIWLLSQNGVVRYDGQSFTRYSTEDGLAENYANFMLQDKNQNYWFGTYNKGVSRYDGRSFLSFGREQGMDNLHVWAMQEDRQGNIWVGTEKGIHLFVLPDEDRQQENPDIFNPLILAFHKQDGLKGEDVRQSGVCLDHNNQLWWATGKGVSMLDLDNFYNTMDDSPPRLYLNSVSIKGTFMDFSRGEQVVPDTEKTIQFSTAAPFQNYPLDLELPYDLNQLSFEFAGLDFAAPHKIEYQYQLQGLEKDWSQLLRTNTADYRSIPYGFYTFKVRARSGAVGKWSEPLVYSFRIWPPWWHSWWAYSLYVLLFGGVFYAVYSFLKKRLLLQNELKLKEQEASRLQELDTFKSRLYTNLTHEFRTPLTVILGMVEQIRIEPKRYLAEGTQLIENNGKNLLRLINQLLDLSKLEDRSFQLNMQQADIVPYVRYVTESFQTYANSKNLSLRFFTTLETLIMDYDENQVQQILTNLISNALKFTPSGGDVIVRLSTAEKKLLVQVRDTGIGIARKDIDHVFDRFYQVDGSHTRKGEGTGIGLAHTLELVKTMSGTITVESEPGKGSVFFIELPICNEASLSSFRETEGKKSWNVRAGFSQHVLPEESPEDDTSSVATEEKESASLSQLLIIEDNPDVVVYLKSCLRGLYQIQVAYNGKIGIEKAIDYIPDLIISDVMMPEKDGYQVCDTLKNDERTSHIPIILLTAKADTTSKISGLRRGADAYLIKPFHKEELLVRLASLVERQKRMVAYFSQHMLHAPATASNEPEAAIELENTFLQKVRQIIEENYEDEQFALPQLCEAIGMSRSQLYRKLQALTGTSPSAFIRSYRLSKARFFLQTTEMNVSEVAWKVGYSNLGHFSKIFQEEFGTLPSKLNK